MSPPPCECRISQLQTKIGAIEGRIARIRQVLTNRKHASAEPSDGPAASADMPEFDQSHNDDSEPSENPLRPQPQPEQGRVDNISLFAACQSQVPDFQK